MTERKFTDEEKILSLLKVSDNIYANAKLTPEEAKTLLNLINRLQAEIERLENEIDKQYEQARADILGNISDGGTSCHWCINQHKAEAIKEFQNTSRNRLIELYKKYYDIANPPKKETNMFYQGRAEAIWECIIVNDNLAKEMAGE